MKSIMLPVVFMPSNDPSLSQCENCMTTVFYASHGAKVISTVYIWLRGYLYLRGSACVHCLIVCVSIHGFIRLMLHTTAHIIIVLAYDIVYVY